MWWGGVTKDEMVGWHHRLNEQKCAQTPTNSGGQGSQARCSPGGLTDADTTSQLNNNNSADSNMRTQSSMLTYYSLAEPQWTWDRRAGGGFTRSCEEVSVLRKNLEGSPEFKL